MADKLGRNYLLEVQTQSGETLEIKLPFTVEFDITRNVLTSANVCQIRVFNLSLNNRNKIRFNSFDTGSFRAVQLKAGYGQNLSVIFEGNITQAWSVREGVNFITQIECYDGGFAFVNSLTNQQFQSGTPQSTIIKSIMGDLKSAGVAKGAIGSFPGKTSRANSYSGSTTEILAQLTNGAFYIDNGKANCLGNSECLIGGIPLINAKSGLLGTPIREQTLLYFDMIFEPGAVAGQRIKLESITEANFNGFYKVVSVKHRGMISEAVCGDAITNLGMFYGANRLKEVPNS